TAGGSYASNVIFAATPSDHAGGVIHGFYPTRVNTFTNGTTLVTCTATDASGNTNACTFNVTVNDTEAPHAICPANIVVSTAGGKLGRASCSERALEEEGAGAGTDGD